jgi:methylmalonyl-CoA mutase C-terminal domain/subunit
MPASQTTRARKIRVLIAKPGLDGHDRGAKVVARALRDHGMEVIYTGLRQTPEQISEAAIQEDVDVVGLSCLSGAHMTLFPRVVEILDDQGAGDIVVLGGGIIPEDDAKELVRLGLYKTFGPGTSTDDIIRIVQESVEERRRRTAKPPAKKKGAATKKAAAKKGARRAGTGGRAASKSTKASRSKKATKRRGSSNRSRGRRS